MGDESGPIDLAERVARIAKARGIDTTLIGAFAMAAHRYVRATNDIDLASCVDLGKLRELGDALEADGLRTSLSTPDDQDPLGGVIRVWTREDEDGDPIEPCEVVNFDNPYRPRLTPATDAIKHAISLPEKPDLRYPRLSDLIALKLYGGGDRDVLDVAELLKLNPDADIGEIRATCLRYGLVRIDEAIENAR